MLHLAVGLFFAALVLSPFFLFRLFSIPTGAMENTLLIGDRIIVRLFPQVTPRRDELIVFRYPMDREQIFVKRVVGVPGDRIRMVSKIVYRDGIVLTEPYAVHKMIRLEHYRDDLPIDPADLPPAVTLNEKAAAAVKDMIENHVVNGDIVVPAGKYFVLGDNRDNSLDSRFWGFVDQSDVVGKPLLVLYSVSEKGETRPRRFLKRLL
jgi:signal peptidase I